MVERTPNFGLELVAFDRRPWIDAYHNNLRAIDAVLAQYVAISNIVGVWENATEVAVGERYVDPDLGTIWEVLVDHTTPSTGTFAASRNSTSGQWLGFTAQFANRGAWAAGTAYSINDIVTDANRVGVVVVAHTAQTSYDTGVTAGNITTLIDLTTDLAAAAASASAAAASAASISLPLPVASGGTGATTAALARAALGLVIGTDVQAYHAMLASIVGLSSATDKGIYFTAANVAALMDVTSAGRALLDDANAAAQRTTLGLVIGTDVQAFDADTLKADTADTLTAGFDATPHALGTITTGTVTPDPADGNFQYGVNNGAFTLAPPGVNCTIVVTLTNDSSAGAITDSGFDKSVGTYDTTDTKRCHVYITENNGFSTVRYEMEA